MLKQKCTCRKDIKTRKKLKSENRTKHCTKNEVFL